ncbi:MAG TPA: beta-ketoacyl-[acyl-carrier-protein] synthase family protein [Terriglobales bacterium]|nr:beta-ketoacyl-[acyl-carrier-protein] synthase family protein [Terriglobales bacterium]
MSCWITGAGAISPLGTGMAAHQAALAAGRGGIGPITAFPSEGFPIACVGEVHDAALPTGSARPEAMAQHALDEALASAGLSAAPDPRRAMAFAIGKPTLELLPLAQRSPGAPPPRALAATHPQIERERAHWDMPALLDRLAARAGATGPRYACYTACASGNDALGLGLRLIERGVADVVIAGGTDAQVHPLSLLEFELLSALSHGPAESACRPFDRDRTGFVVGEGAAVVVLESEAHARRRGVSPRAVLAGYGSSMDAYGLTKCHPQGRGAAQAMRAALADAQLPAEAVDYINAHGTATLLNDQAEAAAIQQVWGAAAERLPVSSTKAMTGHLLTAASALEAVLTLIAIEQQLLPPNLNFHNPDPDCRLHIVTEPRPARVRAAMSNGFGFGGQNASILLTHTGAA